MKKLIFILFLFCSVVSAQNVVSVSFQPIDIGIGVRYDRLLPHCGLYGSVGYGNYRLGDFYLKDHYRLSGGATVPFDDGFISGGINYHLYGESFGIDYKAFEPVSFDVGGGVFIGKVMVAMRFDMMKGEGVVDIGFMF